MPEVLRRPTGVGDEVGEAGELLDLLARPSWHAEAACREAAPSVFFPEPGSSAWLAKSICARCPVLDQCRTWALAQGYGLVGVWGGTTARERHRVAKGR